MPEHIPITPELLIWARERAGFSRKEAIEKFKRFAEWEKGSSFPTYAQLEQLGRTFKVPVAVFFFPSPPQVPPISETFRTLPKSEIDKLPSRIRLLLRKAKSLQLNLSELTDGRNPAEKLITADLSLSVKTNIQDMVYRLRDYIGISIEEQQKWSDNEVALKEWRAALLKVGIFVFKDAFKQDEFSGFCLYDNVFPIIYVNNTSAKTRQIFTYFHELAHLLFHTSGIDALDDSYISNLPKTDQAIEILCNQFAAQFLLPDDVLRRCMKGREASETTAEILANQFHVSREVIFRRFLDEGRITKRQYSTAVQLWNEQRKRGGTKGGDHYWTKLAYLGRDYVSLALSQYYKNRIDDIKLAEYLDTKPKNLLTLEDYFAKGNF